MREQCDRKMAACRTAHHAHTRRIDAQPRVLRPHQPHGSRDVAEHDRMPIPLAAQPVTKHEGGDALRVEPAGVVTPLVVSQPAVATTGADHHRRRWLLGIGRRPPGHHGDIVVGGAERAGCIPRPELDRFTSSVGSDCTARSEQENDKPHKQGFANRRRDAHRSLFLLEKSCAPSRQPAAVRRMKSMLSRASRSAPGV